MGSNNIIINSDGTITRKDVSNKNGGSSDNSGCIWAVIIAVCIIVGIIIAINMDDNDNSLSEPENVVSEEEVINVEETINEATYLSVTQNSVTFDSNGGSVDIEINTDGDWEIGTQTDDWGHLSLYSSYVTLRVESYSGDEDRTDWFTIKAGDIEERIEITQYADNEPSASIESVWVDHNEYMNGVKGMLIHTDISVEHLEGKTIYVYAYFYQADNMTPLHNPYGNDLYFYRTGTVNTEHTSGRFDDFKIFVPYSGLNMAPGTSDSFSFDISVECGGEQLDRNNDNSFTFTSGS